MPRSASPSRSPRNCERRGATTSFAPPRRNSFAWNLSSLFRILACNASTDDGWALRTSTAVSSCSASGRVGVRRVAENCRGSNNFNPWGKQPCRDRRCLNRPWWAQSGRGISARTECFQAQGLRRPGGTPRAASGRNDRGPLYPLGVADLVSRRSIRHSPRIHHRRRGLDRARDAHVLGVLRQCVNRARAKIDVLSQHARERM